MLFLSQFKVNACRIFSTHLTKSYTTAQQYIVTNVRIQMEKRSRKFKGIWS